MSPLISTIIPVYEERLVIRSTLACLESAMAGHDTETIIVDGDPGGSTLSMISDTSARLLTGPRGRGPQMNAGAAEANGEILLFLHADTRLPENAPEQIVASCSAGDIAGGAFSLGIDNPDRFYRLAEALVSLRTHITRIPYGDQAIFIKRSVFHKIGGFTDMPLMEDIDLMLRLKADNHRIAILEDKALTSSRRWEKEGPIFCTIRNSILAGLFYAGVPAERLKRFYPL